ncbi:transposase IS3/IS911 family protein [Prosthecochloris aestuarii DSM 271]|uniref:Transposase IS3/IS911 family protein n=1 Tax=Prosthecochloris aestuarii (strain DSM 271 / SK 413) TaxID=290512 RepID=B4S345_PROA2|nr:transposase IS3/IS911 family protein [Prosthecochloris aestuarii DSM 271]
MKTKRYSTEQIIGILKAAEAGMPVKEFCRKYSVSDATIYNWKSKYSGMSVTDAQRLKELESENNRLKKLVADQALNIQMLKEINSKKW